MGNNITTLLSNFPGGFRNGLTVRGLPILNSHSGKVYWVDSNNGSNSNHGDFQRPFATLAYAASTTAGVGASTARLLAGRGDIIVVKAGHAETVATAAGIALSYAGVTVIGLGSGSSRPTFTFSAASASIRITGAGTTLQNIVGVPASATVPTGPIDVRAADAFIDMEWQDLTATTAEAASVIVTTAAAKRLTVNLNYVGVASPVACVSPINLTSVVGGQININFNGVASTAVVNFAAAVTDVLVTGVFNNVNTALTKDVVDTATGSTWFAKGFDVVGGYDFQGGSGTALAATSTAAVSAAQNVPGADVVTNTLERDVVGNKTDTVVTAVGTTKTLMAYLKGLVTMQTVQTADSANNAFQGDVDGNKTDTAVTAVGTTKSIIAYAKGLVTMNTVQSANSTNNAFAGDVVGNKTDAAVYTPGTTKSIIAHEKGTLDSVEKMIATSAAVISNGLTLFTVTGDILILNLVSVCVTGNNSTASTLQYSATPTAGAATTFSGASATLASAAAGASVVLQGTALSTSPLVNASGVGLGATLAGGLYCPAGTITAVVGVGSTTGTWRHDLRYKALTAGAVVTAGF